MPANYGKPLLSLAEKRFISFLHSQRKKQIRTDGYYIYTSASWSAPLCCCWAKHSEVVTDVLLIIIEDLEFSPHLEAVHSMRKDDFDWERVDPDVFADTTIVDYCGPNGEEVEDPIC